MAGVHCYVQDDAPQNDDTWKGELGWPTTHISPECFRIG